MAKQSWTPKRAAAKSKRKIEAMRKLLLGIAYEWGDESNVIVMIIDDKVMPSLDELGETIAEEAEGEAS